MSTKTISDNRKAKHDFFILETIECGLVLKGSEVKSLRQGKVNLKDSFASSDGLEMYIEGMHISPYDHGSVWNEDPMRKRKLLLHRREILRLQQKVKEKGLTLVPLRLYFKGPRVKLELALARGKKLYDKRATEAEKSAKRDIDRALRARQKA